MSYLRRWVSPITLVVFFACATVPSLSFAKTKTKTKTKATIVNVGLPTLGELVRLSKTDRAKVIQAMRDFLVSAEAHIPAKYADNEMNPRPDFSALYSLLFPNALADIPNPLDKDLCLYGGNVANWTGSVCNPPDAGKCTTDKPIPCNPLIFGMDQNGEKFCVDDGNKATRECNLISTKASFVAQNFDAILQMSDKKDIQSWQGYLDFVAAYCNANPSVTPSPKVVNNSYYAKMHAFLPDNDPSNGNLPGEPPGSRYTDCDLLKTRLAWLKPVIAAWAKKPAFTDSFPIPEGRMSYCNGTDPDTGKAMELDGLPEGGNPNGRIIAPAVFTGDASGKPIPDKSYDLDVDASLKDCIGNESNCGLAYKHNGKLVYFDRELTQGGDPARPYVCVNKTEKIDTICATILPDVGVLSNDPAIFTIKVSRNADGTYKDMMYDETRNGKALSDEDAEKLGYSLSKTSNPHVCEAGSTRMCGFVVTNTKTNEIFDVDQASNGKECQVKKEEQKKEVVQDDRVCNGSKDGYEVFCAGKDDNPATNGGKPYKKVTIYRHEDGCEQADVAVCDSTSPDGPFVFSQHSFDIPPEGGVTAYDPKTHKPLPPDAADAVNRHYDFNSKAAPDARTEYRKTYDVAGNWHMETGGTLSPVHTRFHVGCLNWWPGKETLQVGEVQGDKFLISRRNIKTDVGNGKKKYKNVCTFQFKNSKGKGAEQKLDPFFTGNFTPGRTNWGDEGAQ